MKKNIPSENRSPIQQLKATLFDEKEIQFFIKRDDLLHPEISGNKWRKLKYNILKINELNQKTILTFGGAFSNHIAATAAAGKEYSLQTIGIIRGEKIEPLNPTLTFAENCGMQLKFISRSEYRRKNELDFIQDLKNEFGNFYLLPEGGSNDLAIKGCAEIISETKQELCFLPDYFCVAAGTGTTAAGMISGLNEKKNLIAFSALKGDFLKTEIDSFLNNTYQNWKLNANYHFGGYAKWKPELIDFINNFKREFEIQLEPIYTGKMMFGIFDLIKKDFFEKGTSILAVHTGGLQGIEGFNQRFGKLIL